MNGVSGYAGNIVSPSLTLAIESTRQFLDAKLGALPGSWNLDGQDFPHWPGNNLPAIDDPRQLLKWQPDCRATVYEFEAISGIGFSKSNLGGSLWVTDASPSRKPLVTINRPDLAVLGQQARQVTDRLKDRLMPKSDDLASRDRLTEITSEVVPPFAFWSAALPLHPDRMPRTIELIALTLSLCSLAEQRFKHGLAVARPHQVCPRAFPAILTPAHASLPSGHATESFAVAEVLSALLGAPPVDSSDPPTSTPRTALLALAARIADNRQVAGLHYPIDTLAGRLLGTVLAGYLAARCGQDRGECHSGVFVGDQLIVTDDDALALLHDNTLVNAPDLRGVGLALRSDNVCSIDFDNTIFVETSAPLEWLWKRARVEWGAEIDPSIAS